MQIQKNQIITLSHPILVYDDGQDASGILAYLESKQFPVFAVNNLKSALRKYKSQQPAMVFIDSAAKDSMGLIEELHRLNAKISIAILCPKNQMKSAMLQLKDQPIEFLRKPVDPMMLDLSMVRMKRYQELNLQLKESLSNLENRARTLASETIENERYLVVRQIVERMSHFITQVASNVQGGIKYFNELPYFISIHTRDCRVLAANSTYFKYLGNRLFHNSWEIYVGRRSSRNACPVGRSLNSTTVRTTRALVRYQSGAKVPVIVHTAPIYNNDGEVELILEVFAGSKEIERLAAEIRTTQQRYQQLFDAMPSKVAVLDRRGRITAANKRFSADFGDQLGCNFFDILRPGTFPAYRDPISQTIRDGLTHQGEMVLTDRNGIQYNMMTRTEPITTATGKLIQVIAIFADVTEIRQLEDNLSTLGLMVSTISHDLKGSLTGLDAGLYMIDKGFYRNQHGQIEEGLDLAKRMTERIRKLVMDILFSAKKRKLEMESVDVEQFAGDIAANVENRVRGANINFTCNFASALGQMRMDVKLIRSALTNIIENAVDACIEDPTDKEFTIKFNVKPVEDDVVFEVVDNGGGMDMDTRKQIFNIFYSTKGKKGTGLGLFMTREAVKEHGGSVSVDSHPGHGSTFSICLPRVGDSKLQE